MNRLPYANQINLEFDEDDRLCFRFTPHTPQEAEICQQYLEREGNHYTDAGCHDIFRDTIRKLMHLKRR
jgi:hypothetical protein